MKNYDFNWYLQIIMKNYAILANCQKIMKNYEKLWSGNPENITILGGCLTFGGGLKCPPGGHNNFLGSK